MLMHIGGGHNGEAGIHAHMYYGNDIYYVPEDAKRQKITWIKTINKEGKVTIYMTDDSPYKKIDPPANKISPTRYRSGKDEGNESFSAIL